MSSPFYTPTTCLSRFYFSRVTHKLRPVAALRRSNTTIHSTIIRLGWVHVLAFNAPQFDFTGGATTCPPPLPLIPATTASTAQDEYNARTKRYARHPLTPLCARTTGSSHIILFGRPVFYARALVLLCFCHFLSFISIKLITDKKTNGNLKALPFSVTFAAGAIAGISEILTFYPLDVVKTRMQLDTSKGSQSLVGSFRTIVAQEGCVLLFMMSLSLDLISRECRFGRLYRGVWTQRVFRRVWK